MQSGSTTNNNTTGKLEAISIGGGEVETKK
jgi:hypothetical protein